MVERELSNLESRTSYIIPDQLFIKNEFGDKLVRDYPVFRPTVPNKILIKKRERKFEINHRIKMKKIFVKSEIKKKNSKEFTKNHKIKEIYDEEVFDHETNLAL
jgi:hypothetical protein